jgi:hypothetical protein
VDANKQTLAYVYGHADQRDAGIAKALTLDGWDFVTQSPAAGLNPIVFIRGL